MWIGFVSFASSYFWSYIFCLVTPLLLFYFSVTGREEEESFGSAVDVGVILSILLKFLWKNTSNLFNVASQIDQLSHPHISRLQGIAQKIKYFERLLTVL